MESFSYKEQQVAKLLTPDETANILGITKGTLDVWRCTKRYELNFIKIGKRVMYRSEDILDFIQKRSSTFDT